MRINIEIDTDSNVVSGNVSSGAHAALYRGPSEKETAFAADITDLIITSLRDARAPMWVEDTADDGHQVGVTPSSEVVQQRVQRWAKEVVGLLRSVSDDPELRDMGVRALVAELNVQGVLPSEEIKLRGGPFALRPQEVRDMYGHAETPASQMDQHECSYIGKPSLCSFCGNPEPQGEGWVPEKRLGDRRLKARSLR